MLSFEVAVRLTQTASPLRRSCLVDRYVLIGGLFLTLLSTAPASAALIFASGAGSLPATAQDLSGQFPDEIVGTLDFPDGVNMFRIYLDASAFSAITVLPILQGVPDTELFLFDSSGAGVYMNDDQTFSDTQSCLPSLIGNPCPSPRNGAGPVSSGFYYLAITRSANMPIDSMSNPLFAPLLSTDVAGPVSPNPIADWDNGAFSSPDFDLVNYDIVLTGTIPEPATGVLTAAAVFALGLFRKKLLRL